MTTSHHDLVMYYMYKTSSQTWLPATHHMMWPVCRYDNHQEETADMHGHIALGSQFQNLNIRKFKNINSLPHANTIAQGAIRPCKWTCCCTRRILKISDVHDGSLRHSFDSRLRCVGNAKRFIFWYIPTRSDLACRRITEKCCHITPLQLVLQI